MHCICYRIGIRIEIRTRLVHPTLPNVSCRILLELWLQRLGHSLPHSCYHRSMPSRSRCLFPSLSHPLNPLTRCLAIPTRVDATPDSNSTLSSILQSHFASLSLTLRIFPILPPLLLHRCPILNQLTLRPSSISINTITISIGNNKSHNKINERITRIREREERRDRRHASAVQMPSIYVSCHDEIDRSCLLQHA